MKKYEPDFEPYDSEEEKGNSSKTKFNTFKGLNHEHCGGDVDDEDSIEEEMDDFERL